MEAGGTATGGYSVTSRVSSPTRKAPRPYIGGKNRKRLTIRELKAIASQRKLPRYGDMKKSELIAALSGI
ncbi:Rho termination factor N-terminal domain-containing protein [Chroococcidiopsis sp. CCMEE 29]|uniref:Rho termination factor N-terminal domain-containing protein n=1 Tax=Chroococcidiopsis sp. CCMEE 29 TaxID=155894 RepID=UPI0031F79F62